MTDYFDPVAARHRYEGLGSESLVRIAFHSPDGYAPAAIELAREELARRGIFDKDHPMVARESVELQREQTEKTSTSDVPLGALGKALCFIFAGLVAIIIVLANFAMGKRRAATDALTWMAFGWLVRICLIVPFAFL